MTTKFRQAFATKAFATVALAVACGPFAAAPAAAQTYIAPDPVETRTIVREPLDLTPSQRTTIYRTIIPQGKGKRPIVKEREVHETVGRSAPIRERVITEPAVRERVLVEPETRERVVVDSWGRERIVTTPTTVDYVVGDRVPATVQLSAFPDPIVSEVPSTSGYRYMVVNDRLLLVDPVTGTVVQEIDR